MFRIQLEIDFLNYSPLSLKITFIFKVYNNAVINKQKSAENTNILLVYSLIMHAEFLIMSIMNTIHFYLPLNVCFN